MHSSVEVKAWLSTYRVIWKNWKSKFTVTSYEPTPWYNKVSAELITGHILQGLPKEDSWMTFRTIHISTFKTSTVESAIDLITEHLGMTLAAHESNQPSGNMPAIPMVGGQNIDCYLCKEHGESVVDTRGHKPSDVACPYHDEWKQRVLLSRRRGRTGATPRNRATEARAEERALARATVEREHGRGTIHQRKPPVPYVAQVNIGRVSVPRNQRSRLCR